MPDELMPGIWVAADNSLHFSVPILLATFGWPDDAHHRELVARVIRDVVAEQCPDAVVEDTD